MACVDLKKDTGLVSEQIPIIRSRLGQAYRLTNASMQTLFILFSADVESGRTYTLRAGDLETVLTKEEAEESK